MITLNNINFYGKAPVNSVQTRQKGISCSQNKPNISFGSKCTLQSGLEVDVATPKDAYNISSFVSSIDDEEFDRYTDIAYQAKWLKDNMEIGGLVHVIRDGAQIVGSVSLSHLKDSDINYSTYSKPIDPRTSQKVGLIYCVYLAKHLRGEKNCFHLMKHVIEDAKAQGYKKLILCTTNPAAKHRYTTLGFTEIDKNNLKGFKKGLWFPEDAAWMELIIK